MYIQRGQIDWFELSNIRIKQETNDTNKRARKGENVLEIITLLLIHLDGFLVEADLIFCQTSNDATLVNVVNLEHGNAFHPTDDSDSTQYKKVKNKRRSEWRHAGINDPRPGAGPSLNYR